MDIAGVAEDSRTARAVAAGVGLGGGALARTFGASLMLWARNDALRDQTREEEKLQVMLAYWYAQPEASEPSVDAADGPTAAENSGQGSRKAPESGTRTAYQQYLDASAVCTRLMVPETLPRALSLQNLASCGAVLSRLLNVALNVKRSCCKLDTYLVHMVGSCDPSYSGPRFPCAVLEETCTRPCSNWQHRCQCCFLCVTMAHKRATFLLGKPPTPR